MTAEQFAYWLQGFGELNDGVPSEAQWASIKEHLAQVFVKKTPPVAGCRYPNVGQLLGAQQPGQLIC